MKHTATCFGLIDANRDIQRTMTAQTQANSAPEAGIDRAPFTRFAEDYRSRQDALSLIRQLVQMIKGSQRHRGMSIAMLGGNKEFEPEFDRLQHTLERRLLALQAFTQGTALLSERERENLHTAWLTISRDWHSDSVIDNYELHCHLVEQLLAMLISLSRPLETPMSEPRGEAMETPTRVQTLELLHFCTRMMPSVVEQIGRIRALSSYAAAIGHCDPHHDNKLRYVIQNTKVNNEKLRHQIRRLEQVLGAEFGQLGELKRYELKLMFLLNMVESDVLGGGPITADSGRLFQVATDIIDVYLQVVENGIALLTLWLEQDRERWLLQRPE